MKKLLIKVPVFIVISLFIMQTYTASQKTPVINNNSSTVSKAVTRAKNILDQHKDGFQKIEYTFLWEGTSWILDLIIGLIFGIPSVLVAICVARLPIVYLKEQSYLSDNQFNAIFYAIAIILCVIGVIVLSWWMYKGYETRQNPGCIVLTDTALLSIPPGKNTEYVWFPYKDMLKVKEIRTTNFHYSKYGANVTFHWHLEVTPRTSSECSVWTLQEEDLDSEEYEFLKACLYTKVHG